MSDHEVEITSMPLWSRVVWRMWCICHDYTREFDTWPEASRAALVHLELADA